MQMEMKVAVVHGETDRATVWKAHFESQIRGGVPEDKRTPGPDRPDVFAILLDQSGDCRLEIRATSWDQVSLFKEGQILSITLENK